MNRLLLILIVFACQTTFSLIFSQSPEKMSYQAVVRDNTGELVMNKEIGIRIQIKRGSEFGEAVYVETHTANTSENGLISLEIGGGTIVLGSFSNINWANGPYYIYTEIDPTGKSNYSIFALNQLLSVPYALHAKIADSVPGLVMQNTLDKLKEQIEELILIVGIKDLEGNNYKVINIGSQIWMAENLRVTKFNDGTPIPNITDDYIWGNLTTPGFSWEKNNPANNTTYGPYYNWYVVDTASNGNRNVCPSGWHIPSDNEWAILIEYLGGDSVAGGKMKEAGTTHWVIPNTGATNESGFTALPANVRTDYPSIIVGYGCFFWSSTQESHFQTEAWSCFVLYNHKRCIRQNYNKNDGFSIRCLKD